MRKSTKPETIAHPTLPPRNQTTIWTDLPIEARMKEAHAPLYLKRYE
jgi:hypothetical protein